jgi:FixJ family two-component response regulator
MNGMDVYKHIRQKNKTIPILFMSGNIEFLESIDELKQKDLYMDHLSKPCMNVDYINSINRLLQKASV